MWIVTQLLVLGLCVPSLHARVAVSIPKGNYNVEIYFAADAQALSQYLVEENNNVAAAKSSLREDVKYFLTEVNKLFSSLYETKLQISMKGDLEILDGHPYGTSTIQGILIHEEAALNSWDQWLAAHGKKASLNYDIAILFTGYNLGNAKADTTVGFAHVGTVCQAKANGIVELDGTYSTVVTTAHEIAHILGANHDAAASSYVMAPTSDLKGANRWFFSICSASNTWDVINALTENCMLSSSGSSTPSSGITNNLMDPNVVCQRAKGTDAFLSHYQAAYTPNGPPAGDAICKQFWCAVRGLSNIFPAAASDGMPCAKGKTCKEGTCQSDPSSAAAAAITDDQCVFGDEKLVGSESKTCAEYFNQYGYQACSWDWIPKKCCATYKARKCDVILADKASCPADSPVKCGTSKKCVPLHWLCDNMDDCGNNYDEDANLCPKTNKRGLVDILLDRSLDEEALLKELVSLRKRMDKKPVAVVPQDEGPKVKVEKPKPDLSDIEEPMNVAA